MGIARLRLTGRPFGGCARWMSDSFQTLSPIDGSVVCEQEGFTWRDGVGENLQALEGGAVLGVYADGKEVVLEEDATLIFPKKRPELVQVGKALTLLARAA